MKFKLENLLVPFGFIICFVFMSKLINDKNSHVDVILFANWSNYSLKNGLGNIYNTNIDYLPLFPYLLYIYGQMQGNVIAIFDNMWVIPSLSLVFDLLIAICIYKIILFTSNSKKNAFLLSQIYFLNIFVLYNTIVWWQIDSIVTFFVFFSIIMLYKGSNYIGIFSFILAVNTKLQAAIFLPIIFFMLYNNFCENLKLKTILKLAIYIVIIQILIISPYLIAGTGSKLFLVILRSFDHYPWLSASAFNFWVLLTGENAFKLSDNLVFWGVIYNVWGLLLFCMFSFFGLYHLIKNFLFNNLRALKNEINFEKLLITCALIPLLFFFFNTQMHERYSHYSFAFLACYSILKNDYFPYLLSSISYFLNLEKINRRFHLDEFYETILFNESLIAFCYLISIFYLFFKLFDNTKKQIYSKYFFKYSQK